MKISTRIILPTISTIIIVLAIYYSVVSLAFPIAYGLIIILATV